MKRKLLFAERVIYGDGKAAFNAVVPIKIKGKILMEDLNYALRKLQDKHPFLNAFVEHDENDLPCFVVKKGAAVKIPVRVTERLTDEDWEQESIKEWSIGFDTAKGPLMRVIWVKGEEFSELILIMHHCLCDGRTAMSILADLLLVLDNAEADIGKQDPILSLYDIVPAEVLESKKNIIRAKLKGKMNLLLLWLIPVKKRAIAQRRDYMIHWKLDKGTGDHMIAVAKAAGITINTLLCVIILKAFKEIRKEKFHNNIACPVDIRKYMPKIQKDSIFAFVSMVVLSADNKLDLISNARKMQEIINGKTAKLDPYRMIMMFEESHSSINHLTNFLKYSKPDNDFLFSNLGKIDIPCQYQSFEVETIFSPSAVGPFGNTTGFVASTYRGLMDFTFIGSDGVIPYEEALTIKDKIIEIISEL